MWVCVCVCVYVCEREKRTTKRAASFFPKASDSRKRDSDEKSSRHLFSSSRITYVGGKAVYVTSPTFLREYVVHLLIQRVTAASVILPSKYQNHLELHGNLPQ